MNIFSYVELKVLLIKVLKKGNYLLDIQIILFKSLSETEEVMIRNILEKATKGTEIETTGIHVENAQIVMLLLLRNNHPFKILN